MANKHKQNGLVDKIILWAKISMFTISILNSLSRSRKKGMVSRLKISIGKHYVRHEKDAHQNGEYFFRIFNNT